MLCSLDKKHNHDWIILASSGIDQTTQISDFALGIMVTS